MFLPVEVARAPRDWLVLDDWTATRAGWKIARPTCTASRAWIVGVEGRQIKLRFLAYQEQGGVPLMRVFGVSVVQMFKCQICPQLTKTQLSHTHITYKCIANHRHARLIHLQTMQNSAFATHCPRTRTPMAAPSYDCLLPRKSTRRRSAHAARGAIAIAKPTEHRTG